MWKEYLGVPGIYQNTTVIMVMISETSSVQHVYLHSWFHRYWGGSLDEVWVYQNPQRLMAVLG